METQYLVFIAAAAVCGGAAWQARRSGTSERQRRLFLLLWGILLVGFIAYAAVSFIGVTGYLQTDPAAATQLGFDANTQVRALLATGFAILVALGLWVWMVNPRLRMAISRVLPYPRADRLDDTAQTPWPEQVRGFDAQSAIHAAALGLALLFMLQSLLDYIIAGGQAGLAMQDLDQTRVIVSSALTAAILLGLSLLGVGLGLDRSPRQAASRLGLRRPTWGEAAVGAGAAITLIGFQFCAGLVWMLLTPQSTFEEQTKFSQALTGSVSSIGGAFLVALFSSVGEEIAFRGALQPVIGLWPTALLFAATHAQYQFTPALLIILVVGLVLGLVRQQFGTLASIVTHFTYNFGLLSLYVVLSALT